MTPFKRVWDSSCPREWLRWEADGSTWVVQDLPPEDDEVALHLLGQDMIQDETLCNACGLPNESESVEGCIEYWRYCLQDRTTLACYEIKDGVKTMAGLNVLTIRDKGQPDSIEIIGKKWNLVYDALDYLEKRCDVFDYFGLNRVMKAMGLCVARNYRGQRLGGKILEAREPFAHHFGIEAVSTVFTGPAVQKLATRCGYHTVAEATLEDMARDGLDFPKDKTKVIKYMVKQINK